MVIQVLRTNKSAKTPESEAAAARPPPTAEPPSRVANERPNPNPSRRGRCVHVLSSKPMLTRAYGIFDLSYGTMLIAIHDVLWSAVVVYLLVLGTAHSREVTRIVEGDMQAHLMERAVHALPEKDVMAPRGQLGHENRSYYMRYVEFAFEQAKSVINQDNEQIKLTSGLHLATMLTMMMVFGITMAAIDMMASMMLLAGALLYIRQLMMPWLSLRLIEMMMLVLFAFTALGFPHGLVFWKIFIVMFFALCVVFYHWLVAYSFHEHLCRPERTGLVHHTRPANPHSAVCTYPRAVPGGIILSVGGANVVRRFEGNTDADPSEAADLNPTETRTQMYI